MDYLYVGKPEAVRTETLTHYAYYGLPSSNLRIIIISFTSIRGRLVSSITWYIPFLDCLFDQKAGTFGARI